MIYVHARFAAAVLLGLAVSASAQSTRRAPAVPASLQASVSASAPVPVSVTADGAHVEGRPAARVTLTEYVSYTCPHCAAFSAETAAVLHRDYIAPGRIRREVRHIVRDPVDMAAAIATNCGAPARFFDRHAAMLADQARLLDRVRGLPADRTALWNQGTPQERLRRIALDTGITAWMTRRGFTLAQIARCQNDGALTQRLLAMSNAGAAANVTGTPSFAINGTLLADAHSWAALRPAIDAAIVR